MIRRQSTMIRRILLFVSFLGQPSPLNYSRKLSHLGKQLGSAVFSLIWKTAGNTLNKEDIWEFRYEKQLERTFWFLRENNKHLHDSDRSSRNLRECFGLVCESERVWWERDKSLMQAKMWAMQDKIWIVLMKASVAYFPISGTMHIMNFFHTVHLECHDTLRLSNHQNHAGSEPARNNCMHHWGLLAYLAAECHEQADFIKDASL